MRALVFCGGLVVEGGGQHLFPQAAIDRQVNRVVDAVADHIAVVLAFLQGRPGQAHPRRRQLGVGQVLDPRGIAAQLNAYGRFVLHRRQAGDVLLMLGAGAELPFHPGEVFRAVGADQRGTVEADAAAVQVAGILSLTESKQHLGAGDRAHRVRRLHRRVDFLGAALAPGNGWQVGRGRLNGLGRACLARTARLAGHRRGFR
ncbi:hypothetical protein [Pseudomonas phage PARCL1pr]|nr:hypothetical protein [Pseudomonas phage PARCL1pr]